MEPVIVSVPDLLVCCNCCEPLTIPVSQCDNGHIVCSTCCPKLGNKCYKCSLPTSSKHCKAIENLLVSLEMSCPNAKYGCNKKISYIRKRNHEKECIHVPCYCPISSCGFVASSEVLSKHFSDKHKDSQIKFSYGDSFNVSLKSKDETIVFQEESYGKLFILNNRATLLGNAINICCIGPNSFESECSYDILVRSQMCNLKLQSFAKNVQSVVLATLSSELLVIPFGSFEALKLEICITCINPMMQIFIDIMYENKRFPLMVKSSDTILDVKKKIQDKEGIPVHEQRLDFASKQLENHQTLASYNIQEKSTMQIFLHYRIMFD
ncbi:putative E3 ubiquitin-protein ligase SIN [Medicago truncatula]|uniref:Putative E3 ubiquitin-protein ligase SIN n=1 Tax=Medicago truncatula TaxID=3880 RepID=G7KFR0_MEDTR|nr:seven in absentia family protein [Medicago truncatula]RHN56815.1 putative E3 ubiquitin-protein ligase SIN [Medicago truncatula]